MNDLLAETVEIISPYLIGGVIATFITAGVFFYLTRDFKQHIQCATCRKKMFSVHQDEKTSDKFTENVVVPAELDPRKIEFARYLVDHGYVSDRIK